jgi:NAD(P)-dependent dehydrogenase (short-subunit alcohol dehydrogenase family)
VSTSAVLVTGASSGIGRETAIALADAGFRVFGGVRRPGDPHDFGGRAVEAVTLDVTDAASIAAAVEQVTQATGSTGLQAVVNNAGLGTVGPLEYLAIDELKRIFDVNVFGAMAVTQAFLPLIRAGRGRIVMISSVVAHLPLPFGSPISASKAALSALSESLRRELHAWGIPVILIEPGSIHTAAVEKLKRDVKASLDALPAEGQERYGHAVQSMMDKQMAREEKGSPPAVVAEAVKRALEADRPARRYPVGADARLMLGVGRIPQPMRDEVIYRLFGLSTSTGPDR